MDDFDDIPPPPPFPLFNVQQMQNKQKLYKEGRATFSEQISESSSVVQAASSSGWYEAFDDDRKYSDKSTTGFVGLANQGSFVLLKLGLSKIAFRSNLLHE